MRKLPHDDHEAKMAKKDLLRLSKYSGKLFRMIEENDELEGWVQAKITKAADYIASVYHHLEYEHLTSQDVSFEPVVVPESKEEKIKSALREQWNQRKGK